MSSERESGRGADDGRVARGADDESIDHKKVTGGVAGNLGTGHGGFSSSAMFGCFLIGF